MPVRVCCRWKKRAHSTIDWLHCTCPQQDWLVVSEQNKKDALKDEDGNGIADVDELDATRCVRCGRDATLPPPPSPVST